MTEQNISKKLGEAFKNGMVAQLEERLEKANAKEELKKIIDESNYQFKRCDRNHDYDGMRKFLDLQSKATELFIKK